ncbi:ParA family protein [Treponema primitia]|uniref:ParA family protein n=1 Tax=Treponema primitia TaxID=88058 RepID=UPI000255586B|nr:ParA family protein [Treponema primitia]
MKTIAINSIKGGTGKSTLSVLFVKALIGAGYKCLVIDADASNNSLSFYLDDSVGLDITQGRTIFDLFLGAKVQDCIIRIQDNLNLIRGDVRLNEFRSTDSLKRLKRALQGLGYDFCIIDTSPTYDNIIGNVLTASDVLLVPVQQDIFSYQALKYQFEKLADLELDDLDIHVIFNQFEKPLNDNQETYRNQITNMFLKNEVFRPFINSNHISRSSVYRKYINKRNYRLSSKAETQNGYEEVKNLIQSILGISIKEAI